MPIETGNCWTAIQAVSSQGMTDTGAVHSHLVSPRVIGLDFHQRKAGYATAPENFAQRVLGWGTPPLPAVVGSIFDHDHLSAVHGVIGDGKGDALWSLDLPSAEGDIMLSDRPGAKLLAQRSEGLGVPSGQNQSRSLDVQSVQDPRFPGGVAEPAHLGKLQQQRSGHRASLVWSQGMTRNTGRLFDHDVVFGRRQDLELDRGVRGRFEIGSRRQTFEGNHVTGAQQVTLPDPPATHPNLTGFAHGLGPGAAHAWHTPCQHLVDPLTIVFRTNLEPKFLHLAALGISQATFPDVALACPVSTIRGNVSKRDYYEILEVSRTADGVTLKRAYRKIAMQYHPDRNPDDPVAEDKFKEATEAYTILSNDDKRRRYDRYGHAAFESANGSGFEPSDFGAVSDILEGLFGEVFAGRRKRRTGRDLTYDLELSFVEAALGVEKTIQVNKPLPCEPCEGTGAKPGTPVHACNICQGRGDVKYQRGLFAAARPCHGCRGTGKKIPTPCDQCKGTGAQTRPESMNVKIPAGVQDGAVRTVRGAGEPSAGGNGDLHINIKVTDHDLFQRNDADILITVPISYPQAVLGASIEVPTLEGNVLMKIPPGTQSGKVFRLRGKGIPVYGGYGKGDQLVTLVVEVPKSITRKQRKLITELAEHSEDGSHPQRASFLGKLRNLFES